MSTSFKTFIRAAQQRAMLAGIRLPMQKLREALAMACYGRGYSATLAAIAAGKEVGPPLPARFIDLAAQRYSVDPDAMLLVLHGETAPVDTAASGLPAIGASQRWHVVGVPGSGKTTFAVELVRQYTRELTCGAALYITFAHRVEAGLPSEIEQLSGVSGEIAGARLRDGARMKAPAIVILDDIDHCADPDLIESAFREARKIGLTVITLARGQTLSEQADTVVILQPEFVSSRLGALPERAAGNVAASCIRGVIQGVVHTASEGQRQFLLPIRGFSQEGLA